MAYHLTYYKEHRKEILRNQIKYNNTAKGKKAVKRAQSKRKKTHPKYISTYMRDKRKAAKRKGMCLICFRRKSQPRITMCSICRHQNKKNQRKRRNG